MRWVFSVWLLFCGQAMAAPPAIPPGAPGIPTSSIGQPNGVAGLDGNGRSSVGHTYTDESRLRYICPAYQTQGSDFNSGYGGETDRLTCTTTGPITELKLWYPGLYRSNGIEQPLGANSVFYQAALEYPCGVQLTSGPALFTQNGSDWIKVAPDVPGAYSDGLGVNIPAGAQFCLRSGAFVTLPPASISASAVSGGSLSASTTYYYKATSVKFGSESNATSEASATTGASGTLSVALTMTATAGAVGCDTINIYRSTTTGAETYLASIPCPSLSFTDTGTYTPVSQTPPTTAGRYQYGSYILGNGSTWPTSWWSNAASFGGSGANIVSGYGTSGFTKSGPSNYQVFTPLVLADDMTAFNVCGAGDNIQDGSGIISNIAVVANAAPTVANWFDQGRVAAGLRAGVNSSVSGTLAAVYTSNGVYGAAARMTELQPCSYIVSDLGINDIKQATPWYSLALTHLEIGRGWNNRGKRYVITTLLPYTTTIDHALSLTNQTVTAYEPQRTNYNAWVRNGRQVRTDAFVGSMSGTTLTAPLTPTLSVGELVGSTPPVGLGLASVPPNTQVTAVGACTTTCSYTVSTSQTVASMAMTGTMPVLSGGVQSPYIFSYFDLDNALGEVNVSGVQTPNGGYWPAPCTTGGTPGSTIATGCVTPVGTGTLSGTQTASALAFTGYSPATNALINDLLEMTSGTQIGQTCLIISNTASTIFCNGNSETLPGAPASGDTFSIYVTYTQEGSNPTPPSHNAIAVGTGAVGYPNFSAWAAANLVPF
jgi:hypothetical protein